MQHAQRQELSDWQVVAPLPQNSAKREHALATKREVFEGRMVDFMEAQSLAAAGRRKNKAIVSEEDAQRKSNLHMANARDKALHAGTGVKWAEFFPEHRLLPLAKGETRYFAVVATRQGQVTRAMVQDDATGARWLELPDVYRGDVLWEPTLHTVLDRGAVGKPLAEFELLELGANGTVNYDPWHIFDSSFQHAEVDAGIWADEVYAMLSYNVFKGPYFANTFWKQFQGSRNEDLYADPETDAVFDIFYPLFLKAFGVSEQQGADPSMKQKVKAKVSNSDCYKHLKSHVKMGRWNALFNRHAEVLPVRLQLAYGLIKMGIRRLRFNVFLSSTPCIVEFESRVPLNITCYPFSKA